MAGEPARSTISNFIPNGSLAGQQVTHYQVVQLLAGDFDFSRFESLMVQAEALVRDRSIRIHWRPAWCASRTVARLIRRSMNSSDPILVTGAAGFIGFHVACRLARDGRAVIGIDNLNSYYDPALKKARLAELSALPYGIGVWAS